MLAVSSLEKGVAPWTDNGLHLKFQKINFTGTYDQ